VSYSIRIKRSAAREIGALPREERARIVEAIDSLREQALRGHGLKGDLTGLRRLRVGHYRVIYELQQAHLVVLVLRVGHRKDVYR
jgi:mRNA interferase RelE/StbE